MLHSTIAAFAVSTRERAGSRSLPAESAGGCGAGSRERGHRLSRDYTRSMTSHRAQTRPPRGETAALPPLVSDPDALAAYLEDAAHFPGGRARAVAHPRTEAEVAALLNTADHMLPIGAQSSLTGGATPMGDLVISLARMDHILEISDSEATVQAGVPLAQLQEVLARENKWYPPVPTFDGAFAGGVAATNAAGASTFKYGTTREWIRRLTVVLATGEVLDLTRGEVCAHPNGYFEIEGQSKSVRKVPVPTYRMPKVPKCSAGYFAAPRMDLTDLFIGSEGTLGIITEITFAVRTPAPAMCLIWIPVRNERTVIDLVGALRDASHETWRSNDRAGIDIAGVEHLDRRCLELLREDDASKRHQVSIPPQAGAALLAEIELPARYIDDPSATYDEIAGALRADAAEGPLVRLCRLLHRFGLLESAELVPPSDRRRRQQLVALREAVPQGVNQRVSLAKRTVDPAIEKTAADMIVPFDRVEESLRLCRREFERRSLDYAIWGHISDGNLHPNVIPHSIADVQEGKAAILEFGAEVIRMGGSPLAEHGVGRNPVKQALLRQLYGDRGIEEMRRVKEILDPAYKLAPGVIFPKR